MSAPGRPAPAISLEHFRPPDEFPGACFMELAFDIGAGVRSNSRRM